MWLFKWEFLEDPDPRTSQDNDFSPVCVRMWLLKWKFLVNANQQISQENVFPQHVFTCDVSNGNFRKILIHKIYKKIVSLQGVFACVFSNCNLGEVPINKFYKKIVSYYFVFACVFLNLYAVKMLSHIFTRKCPALHIGCWILNKVKMLIYSMKQSWLSLVKKNSYWLSICISKHIFYIWYVFECLF